MISDIYNPGYEPDYMNIVKSARNVEAPRLPLFEYIIHPEIMERILGRKFAYLQNGDYADKKEYYRIFCDFFRMMGYDTVSHECCSCTVIANSAALAGLTPGPIQTREDFEKFPWEELPDRFFAMHSDDFRAISESLPAGMKLVGGIGNGIFELVEDMVGYVPLCYMSIDDPELYADIFKKAADLLVTLWTRFIREFGDSFCVFRFGDDLGYKTATLIAPDEIRRYVIPGYKRIIDLAHREGKPFLLHSCGCIFPVMEDLITAGIDAKHSNEDQIAPFSYWVEQYGDRIGNFGGLDMDVLCRYSKPELKDYITGIVRKCTGHGGFAFGSGNSIPAFVPEDNYLEMNRIVRELRGETKA